MKKIRTILSFYNGEKFIDEQLQSILDQEIPEGYFHEVYVYDDGSKKESIDYLKQNWADKVSVICNGENWGIYKRYLTAFADAIDGNVDILFLADQDDVFLPNKYMAHIKKHEEKNAFVSSLSEMWYFETNEFKSTTKHTWAGHRSSFLLDFFREKSFDSKAFREQINHFAKTEFAYAYHDMLLGLITGVLSDPVFIDNKYNNWRVHGSSQTNSGQLNFRSNRASSNQYDYFFSHLKVIMKSAFNIKVSIWSYNKAFSKFDDRPKAAKFKAILDTFAMLIRAKFLRNAVCDIMDYKLEKNHKKQNKFANKG